MPRQLFPFLPLLVYGLTLDGTMPSAIKIFAAGLIICAATKIVESEPLVGSEIRVEPGGLQSALDQVGWRRGGGSPERVWLPSGTIEAS